MLWRFNTVCKTKKKVVLVETGEDMRREKLRVLRSKL